MKLVKIEKVCHFQIFHCQNVNTRFLPPFRLKLNDVLCKSLRVLENPTDHITTQTKYPLSCIYSFDLMDYQLINSIMHAPNSTTSISALRHKDSITNTDVRNPNTIHNTSTTTLHDTGNITRNTVSKTHKKIPPPPTYLYAHLSH